MESKNRMRAAWEAGDFGEIARLQEAHGEEFVARLGLKPGMRVLDVGCGTGNQTIPAARTGARVTGLDLAANLLAQGQDRARNEELDILWIQGDAEQLPLGPGKYDVVLSMFGAMAAPRPERVAAELLRVCQSDGLVAMGNWTPEGFFGEMEEIRNRHVPPPTGVPSPLLWGDDRVVRERLGGESTVETTKREAVLDYPFGPRDVVEFFRKYHGPSLFMFAQLDAVKGERSGGRLDADLDKMEPRRRRAYRRTCGLSRSARKATQPDSLTQR